MVKKNLMFFWQIYFVLDVTQYQFDHCLGAMRRRHVELEFDIINGEIILKKETEKHRVS